MRLVSRPVLFLVVVTAVFRSLPLAAAERPTAGIGIILSNSPRTTAIASLLRLHLDTITGSTASFSLVKSDDLVRQLNTFNCADDKCQLRFAEKAGIALFMSGEVIDRGKSVRLVLNAWGIAAPAKGTGIVRYAVDLPVTGSLAEREFSYIAEEHAAHFLVQVLEKFRWPVAIIRKNSRYAADWDIVASGEYPLYRRIPGSDPARPSLQREGSVLLNSNFIENVPAVLAENPEEFVILGSAKARSKSLEDFYHGRKKEIVFAPPEGRDSFYALLISPPASALMPIAAPVLYYTFNDWEGAGLWLLNSSFYIGMEIAGWVNYADDFRKRRASLSREVVAGTIYTWYLFAAGGLGPVVDSLSWTAHNRAAQYQGVMPYLGNDVTAGILAFVSGGAGHFYRGDRFWGYLYYHINNLLIYFIIRELVSAERWDSAAGAWVIEQNDKTLGYVLLGLYGAVKIVEVLHAVFMKDRIRNGSIAGENIFITPSFSAAEDGTGIFGARVIRRF